MSTPYREGEDPREGEAPAEPRPSRRHPDHGILEIPNQSTIIFLTVCTKGRSPWLAAEEHHAILRSVWSEATAWLVGRYVLMPDHLHLFAAPGNPELPLENWVKYWKSQFSKANPNKGKRFQTDHWDTRLRQGDSYDEKWAYVVNNPVRHKLVAQPEDWPYQGVIFDLVW